MCAHKDVAIVCSPYLSSCESAPLKVMSSCQSASLKVMSLCQSAPSQTKKYMAKNTWPSLIQTMPRRVCDTQFEPQSLSHRLGCLCFGIRGSGSKGYLVYHGSAPWIEPMCLKPMCLNYTCIRAQNAVANLCSLLTSHLHHLMLRVVLED